MRKTVTYVHLAIGDALPSAQGPRPFKAVVVIEQTAPAGWQSLVSDWLVESGCLSMAAWGCDCSSWDDSVDYANLSAFDFAEIPEDALVMTTWHPDEPLEEALRFVAHTDLHPGVALGHTLILHIGPKERRVELLRALQEAESDDT
jgi:hypothetical protein